MSLIPKQMGYADEIPGVNVPPDLACPNCKGKGRVKRGHSFVRGNIYSRCTYCGCTGLKSEAVKNQLRRSK